MRSFLCSHIGLKRGSAIHYTLFVTDEMDKMFKRMINGQPAVSSQSCGG